MDQSIGTASGTSQSAKAPNGSADPSGLERAERHPTAGASSDISAISSQNSDIDIGREREEAPSAGSGNPGLETDDTLQAKTSTPVKSPQQKSTPLRGGPGRDPDILESTKKSPSSKRKPAGASSANYTATSSTPTSTKASSRRTQAIADEAVIAESEKLKLPESQPMILVGVMMKEATIDSPAFRASSNFIDTQFRAVEKWIDAFLHRSEVLVKGLEDVREKVNNIISLFMPDFAFTNILSEDYTSLAFGRYTQSLHLFWVVILSELQTHHKVVVEKLTATKTDGLQVYQAARKKFLSAQRAFDDAHALYMSLDPHLPEAELRQSAVRAWEARRTHLESAYDLCLATSRAEALISVSLIEALTHPFQIRRKSFMLLDQERIDIGIDMHRLASVAAQMRSSLPHVEADLRRLKKQMLAQFARMSPDPESRSTSTEATSAASPDPNSTVHSVSSIRATRTNKSVGKFGWVYLRKDSSSAWKRLWAFVQNGYMGFLGVSADGLYVQESRKYPVKGLRVAVLTNEPRRFVFSVDGSNLSRTHIQARTAVDLQSWLDALGASKATGTLSDALSTPWSNDFALKVWNDTSRGSAQGAENAPVVTGGANGASTNQTRPQVHPSRSKSLLKRAHSQVGQSTERDSASPGPGNNTSSPSVPIPTADAGPSHVEFEDVKLGEKVKKRLREMQAAYSSPSGIIHSSSLSLDDLVAPAPSILATKPLPTSKSLESVVANWYLSPHGVPNAITSNFWGTVNWVTFNTSIERDTMDSASTRPLSGIKYPAYYPKTLVLQDGDMRSVLEGLANPNPDPEDLLMMVIRCTAKVGKDRRVPARMYVTSRKLYIYGAWQGLIGLQKYDLDSILEVECVPGVDYDELRFVITIDSEPLLLVFRLYIDNGALAKQRLDFLITNCRSKKPLSTQSVQESLIILGGEFAHAKEKHASESQGDGRLGISAAEARLAHMGLAGDPNSSKPNDDTSNSDEGWLKSFLWKQLRLPTISHSNGGKPHVKPYKSSTWKFIESTFTVKPRVLFLITFGNRSNVFKSVGVPIVKSNETQVLPWYQQGKKLQRHVVIRIDEDIAANSHGLTFLRDDLKKDHIEVQTVVKSEDNLTYVVEEKHPYIQMPDLSVFNVIVRYIIYSTDSGSQLQIWGRINWKREGKGKPDVAQGLMYEISKARARDTLVRVRDGVKQLENPTNPSTEDVVKKFGKVKATAKPPPAQEQIPETVTTVRQSSILSLVILRPFQFSFDICHLVVVDSFVYLSQLPLWRLSIIGFLFLSVLLNLLLATRSTLAFWKAYWMDHSDQKRIDHLGFLSPNSIIFKRAVYVSELDDAIRNGSLFNPRSDVSLSACASKFTQLVDLADSYDDEPYYVVEPQAMDFLEEIDDIRTRRGLERTQLATRMRLLNMLEREELLDTYSKFLVREISMCSRTREKIYTLDAAVFEGIQDYCRSCLTAASRDLL